ncbi:uncharacterized protein LOC128222703 [Mya arenaria]|uniref:uncharacterized protein LOC128222703 n=1 Tax=Mya arenaria TaxID=6604 RepID=UPI0022E952CE|nr:uncharacterized protein LOC128222703 [Mya arenaria]
MHTQVAGSAQSTRSPERTKAYILITAWATRILAFLSIAIQIMAFVTVGDIVFGQFLMVTAILSCMSPLNFKCCFYRDCSRNTKTEKAIGHWSVYVWLFMSNIGYVILFGYTWFFWGESKTINHDYDRNSSQYPSTHTPNNYYNYNTNPMPLIDTVFLFTLIITFFLSILNLYSFCLVYKYGFCFMNGIKRDHSDQVVETAVVMNQQLFTIGEGPLRNGLQFTYAEVETIGVKNYSVDASVQSAMAETYGQPAIPQTNAEANLIV